MVAKMSKQDLQWQAENDAQTMARYQEIMSNPTRKSRAIKEATKQAADLTKRATAMKNAAGIKSGSKGKKK